MLKIYYTNPIKSGILVLFLAFFQKNWTQEGVPIYLDYMTDNYYLVYPSMAGISHSGKVRFTARQQWFGTADAPRLQTLNAQTRLGEHSGIGAILFNDKNGYHSQTGLELTYAYHLDLWRQSEFNQVSFGINGAFFQNYLDQTEFDLSNPDPVISGTRQSADYYNVDIGVSYTLLDFYAHFTVKNLLFVSRGISSDLKSSNHRRYMASSGYLFDKDSWIIEPSVLFQWVSLTGEKIIDLSTKLYKDLDFGTLWGGLAFRQGLNAAGYVDKQKKHRQSLRWFSPILGVNYKRLMFGYTYSYQFGDVAFAPGGFHQIILGYDFWKSEKPKPCHCPWME